VPFEPSEIAVIAVSNVVKSASFVAVRISATGNASIELIIGNAFS